jgi:hypothetical protein
MVTVQRWTGAETTALRRAPEEVKTRFTQAVGTKDQEPTTASPPGSPETSHTITQWNHHSITLIAQQITGEDLSIPRRNTLGPVFKLSTLYGGSASSRSPDQ